MAAARSALAGFVPICVKAVGVFGGRRLRDVACKRQHQQQHFPSPVGWGTLLKINSYALPLRVAVEHALE